MTQPAYNVMIWTWEHAPDEYKAHFKTPIPEMTSGVFIVWEQRFAPQSLVEWVVPNGVWWELWHYQQEHTIDEHTKIYCLQEMVVRRE